MKRIITFLKRLLGLCRRRNLQLHTVPNIDYGTLNAQQRNAFDNILSACKNGSDTAEIPKLTQAEFDSVVSHIGLYFGTDFHFDHAAAYKEIAGKRQNAALVNLDVYERAKAHKAELDARVDKALSSMREGSNESKLEQIAKYIANHGSYEYGTNNPLELLDGGGMCGAYAMLFYKMATRLGLQAYICYGYASNGSFTGAHAWNKVELPEGVRYYDITFYDGTVRNRKWLGSVDGWGRVCSVNDKSALRKRG